MYGLTEESPKEICKQRYVNYEKDILYSTSILYFFYPLTTIKTEISV